MNGERDRRREHPQRGTFGIEQRDHAAFSRSLY